MIQRKSFRVEPKAGSIRNLKLVTESLPAPAAGEVRVAIKAIGLNFADIFAVFGLYKATPKGSFVPGLEYAGVVEALGEGVTDLQVGDRVMGVTRFGAYTSHLNIDARYVVPLPEGWSFETGAALLVQALTAYYALYNLGELKQGQSVLIHSVAGGVGILANRMARKTGAFVIGTIGSEGKREFMEKEGIDRLIVRGKDFEARLKEALGERDLNLVLDPIGGKILKIGFKTLAPMGRMVVYGSARYAHPGDKPNIFKLLAKYFTRPKLDPQAMTNFNKGVLAFNLIFLYEKTGLMQEIIGQILEMDIEPPHVGHTFDFEEIPDALRLFLTGKTIGKVIVRV